MSGLSALRFSLERYLGLRPRLVYIGPSALLAVARSHAGWFGSRARFFVAFGMTRWGIKCSWRCWVNTETLSFRPRMTTLEGVGAGECWGAESFAWESCGAVVVGRLELAAAFPGGG